MPIIDYINPYAYLMRLRRMMYQHGWLKSFHPGVPVISIGNLTVGGTGKSPMVMLIADYLERMHGKKVAIVSRGYRRRSKGYVLVRDGMQILASVEQSGDEAQMFAERLPNAIVIVDEDRWHGAREAKALGADVIVLDDGYQHLRLKRDLNILLVDASRSISPVIPFGRSREPLSAANAADIVIETNGKQALPAEFRQSVTAQTHSKAASLMPLQGREALALKSLNGKKILALSSIASPKRFHRMLDELGANLVVRDLGDHAEYSQALVNSIISDAQRHNVEMIVTTLKDAVKSRRYFHHSEIPVYILLHELEFLSGEEGFYNAIDQIL